MFGVERRFLTAAALRFKRVLGAGGISACEIQAKWPMALAILHDACNGVKLHLVTFGAMLTTARRAAAWEATLLHVWLQMLWLVGADAVE